MCAPAELIWIKNCNHPAGEQLAYPNYNFTLNNNANRLHWLHPGDAQTANTADLILLFQRPQIPGDDDFVYFTHIVRLVDDIVRVEQGNDYPYYRLVDLVAIANPYNQIPRPGNLRLGRVNQIHTYNIDLVDRIDNITVAEMQNQIWLLFQNNNFFNPNLNVAII